MTQKLKVAYLLGTFPQQTQTFVTREIDGIRQHDIDIWIFSLFRPRSIPDDDRAQSLLPHTFYIGLLAKATISAQFYFLFRSPSRYLQALLTAVLHTYREPKMLLKTLALFPKSVYFARKMEAVGTEHIHAHFVTLAAISASIASRLLGISFSIHPHAVGLFSRDPKDVRRQLESASKIVTISNYHRAYIAKLCPQIEREDIEVIYCSLDPDRFQPAPKLKSDRPLQILSVGRLIEKKGFEYLIEACQLLDQWGFSFQCNIVGEGPLQTALQQQIESYQLQERIALLGGKEESQVLELYQDSDIFALACVVGRDGNQDGLPVVLMEAMSCELPTISTSISGIVDLIHHEQTGLLVNERDSNDLAQAMRQLFENKAMRQKLGQQGRQKILQDFHIQKNTAKLSNIFQTVVRSRNNDLQLLTSQS